VKTIKGLVVWAQNTALRCKGKKGQTLVEYALILSFISVLAIVVLSDMGRQIMSIFTTISLQLTEALQHAIT